MSARCNRVHVIDGHMVTMSVELEKRGDARAGRPGPVREYACAPSEWPGCPARRSGPILVPEDAPTGPQPRRDRMSGGGMEPDRWTGAAQRNCSACAA